MIHIPKQDTLKGLFVTGTDTNVGKTVVSSCLVAALTLDYWKPIQCGLSMSDDSLTVLQLTGVAADRVHPNVHRFQAHLSPHEAACSEGIHISLGNFQLPQSVRPVVVEGAGGVLVPINNQHLMIDLMARLGLPIVLVARSNLGTINHTLLSLSVLRSRGLHVLGVVMNGSTNMVNRVTIENYGRVPVMELPQVDRLDTYTVTALTSVISEVFM